MVGKTNEEFLPSSAKDDANWEMVRDAYPDFAVVRIPLGDPVAIRLAAEIVAGLAQRLLALTHRTAGLDKHAAISKCYDTIRIANARIKDRPVRMKSSAYIQQRNAAGTQVVNGHSGKNS